MPFDPDPTFRTHRVREGYDLDDVDDFVDRVLDNIEGRAGAKALTPDDIEAYEFRVVRFRESYSMDDVDDWLDAAAAQLRAAAAAAPVPAPVADHQVYAGVPGRAPVAAAVPAARAYDPEVTQAWPAPQPAVPATAAVTVPPVSRPEPRDLSGDALGNVLGARIDPYGHGSAVAAPRPRARTVASVAAPSTGLHHLEIWVDDLAGSSRSFGWLFERLGWTLFQVWEQGRAWQAPGHGPYVVLEASPALVHQPHDRHRPGLNHLALAVPERWMVDRIVTEAPSYGWRLLFADQHPYAGGPAHYAAYLENAQGFEVEVVAA